MPMVNGKKYPYTKAGKKEAEKAAKAAKVKKASGGMVRTKGTAATPTEKPVAAGPDVKPDLRTPLPFMCGGGPYKAKAAKAEGEKKKRGAARMKKAEGGPVMADKREDRPDRPEEEDMRAKRNTRTKRSMRPARPARPAKNNMSMRNGRK